LSENFQQYAKCTTDKRRTLTQSVHIPTRFSGGQYRHHGIQLAS